MWLIFYDLKTHEQGATDAHTMKGQNIGASTKNSPNITFMKNFDLNLNLGLHNSL